MQAAALHGQPNAASSFYGSRRARAADLHHTALTSVKSSLATDSGKHSLFSHYDGRVTKPRIKLQPYQQPVCNGAITHQTLRRGDIKLATLKQFNCQFSLYKPATPTLNAALISGAGTQPPF